MFTAYLSLSLQRCFFAKRRNLLLLLLGCCWSYMTVQAQPLFTLLQPSETGVQFRNDINESENLNVLAYEYFYNGGGVAVGDLDNDGLPDLFFTANMQSNKLYRNLGHMQFKDMTRDAGTRLGGRPGGWKTGVTMADVNGDGLLDIYVCYSGKVEADQRRNQLFINQGKFQFVEQAKAYGLDDPGYSTQAVFFDYDNDEDLDMFLLNHNVKKYDNMELARLKNEIDTLAGDKLFENQGSHFAEVSAKAGIHQYPLTFGLGVAIADINKDGWQDIYVTNDYNESDYLYLNNGNGTFREESRQCLRHLSQFSMGVDIADFNNDGLPDILTLDMLPEDNRRQKLLQLQENYESFQLMLNQDLYRQYMRNMLHLNNGDGTFSEIGQLAGVSNTDWSWCPLFADFDNDGFKDIFITNGYLRDYTNKDFLRYWGDYKVKKAMDREPTQLMDLVKAMPTTVLANYIFRNNQDLTFSNKQQEWGLDQPVLSNGAVYADLDNDGDLDLVVNTLNNVSRIYRNRSREDRHTAYLSVAVAGKGKNTHAIGATVTVYAKGQMQYQEVNPNKGYLSSVSTLAHFGLGNLGEVDSVRVTWPGNVSRLLTHIAANQQLRVTPVEAEVAALPLALQKKTWFKKAAPLIDYRHEAFVENDFKRQLLMLFMYSAAGPVLATADVNRDGREDVFVSGDKNKPGVIYLQQQNGKFIPVQNHPLGDENISAAVAADFFDANGDGFPDLYLAHGGYSLFEPHTPALQDELYLNDGKGNFSLSAESLPDVSSSSKSCIRYCDYDGDGDLDVFVGGRVIPGQYPLVPESFLLVNDGKGRFTKTAAPFAAAGMVTDAQWADLDKDGRKDLILCGEMMPLKVYLNTAAGFVDQTASYFPQPVSGFWFGLTVADVDGDGNLDILAGNLGLNSQVRATPAQPAELYYADFDGNGSVDPFFNFYVQGTSYPFVSRDELNEQIYPMRKKFTSYKAYSNATMKDIFSPEDLSRAGKWVATETRSMCFLNKGGKLEAVPLPVPAQFSVVTRILCADYNHDGTPDLLLLGNHSDNRLKLGSIDAGYGCLLAGDGKGQFVYVPQPDAGICITGDVKAAKEILVNGKKYLFAAFSNEALQFYLEQ